jgi:predicted nucleotidyltransferase
MNTMHFGEPFGGVIPGARGAVLATLLRTGEPLTGRQIYGLVSDDYSLWSVQEALKALSQIGLVDTQTVGRAGVHVINEGHSSVAPLRELADPILALASAIGDAIDSDVQAVILFGSIARGEATRESDIDLAVISSPTWDKRIELQDTVREWLGNNCDVLVFTEAEFSRLAATGEPVVSDIVRDGVALVGSKPRWRLAADAATSTRVSTQDLATFAEEFGDLADPEVMNAAWRLQRLIEAAGMELSLDVRPRRRVRFLGPVGSRVEANRAVLMAALERHGVTNPRVFGSVARNEDTDDSDLDLLAKLPDEMGLVALGRLQAELEKFIAAPVDIVPERDLKPRVRTRIEADVVPL